MARIDSVEYLLVILVCFIFHFYLLSAVCDSHRLTPINKSLLKTWNVNFSIYKLEF